MTAHEPSFAEEIGTRVTARGRGQRDEAQVLPAWAGQEGSQVLSWWR